MTQAIPGMQTLAGAGAGQDRLDVVSIAPETETVSEALQKAMVLKNRYLLVFRYAVFNLIPLALLAAAFFQGWIGIVLEADGTGISVAIFGIFVGGMVICSARIWQISRELNHAYDAGPSRGLWAANHLKDIAGREAASRAISGSALRLKVTNWIGIVRQIANSLVLLGLIGTVLGFIIALSGVDPSEAGNVAAIAPMVTELIRGMSVALYTTLVGAVLNLWLMANYHILAGGAVTLVTTLVALGESNARPRSA